MVEASVRRSLRRRGFRSIWIVLGLGVTLHYEVANSVVAKDFVNITLEGKTIKPESRQIVATVTFTGVALKRTVKYHQIFLFNTCTYRVDHAVFDWNLVWRPPEIYPFFP